MVTFNQLSIHQVEARRMALAGRPAWLPSELRRAEPPCGGSGLFVTTCTGVPAGLANTLRTLSRLGRLKRPGCPSRRHERPTPRPPSCVAITRACRIRSLPHQRRRQVGDIERSRQSPRCAVLEQHGPAIRRGRGGWQQPKFAGLPRRPSDLEGRLHVVGDDPSDRGVSVEDGQRSTSADHSQVPAEMGLEIGNPNLAHDLIVLMTGHIVELPTPGRGRDVSVLLLVVTCIDN